VEIGPANTEKLSISSAGVNFITNGVGGFCVNGIAIGGGGGSSAWGSITGSISDQGDLQAALDGKISNTSPSLFALAVGCGATASSYGSAFGNNSGASDHSASFGSNNAAYGTNSASFGSNNAAYGTNSSVLGSYNIANADGSSAFGSYNLACDNANSAFGYSNCTNSFLSSAFGGYNIATGCYSTASGVYNTTSGGLSSAFGVCNTASGLSSSAFGSCLTNATDCSAMLGTGAGWINVLSDSCICTSSGANLTTGGAWTNASSRDLKENFTTLDSTEVLRKIVSLPITQWNYKKEDRSVTHIGPMAQDFYNTFGVGGSNTSISTIDPAGIALVGIQALNTKIDLLQDTASTTARTSSFNLFTSIKEWVLDKVTATVGVFGRVETKKIKTEDIEAEKLCLKDVCITSDELRSLLEKNGNSVKIDQGQIIYPGYSDLDIKASSTQVVEHLKTVQTEAQASTTERVGSTTPTLNVEVVKDADLKPVTTLEPHTSVATSTSVNTEPTE
jgi:hypothetical protein